MTTKWYNITSYQGIGNTGYTAVPFRKDYHMFCNCCGSLVVENPSEKTQMSRNTKGIKVAAGKFGTNGWVSKDGKKQVHVVETKNGPVSISLKVGF
jgi:hypothetical protein